MLGDTLHLYHQKWFYPLQISPRPSSPAVCQGRKGVSLKKTVFEPAREQARYFAWRSRKISSRSPARFSFRMKTGERTFIPHWDGWSRGHRPENRHSPWGLSVNGVVGEQTAKPPSLVPRWLVWWVLPLKLAVPFKTSLFLP